MRVEDFFKIFASFRPGMNASPEEVRSRVSELFFFCANVNSIDIDSYIRSTGEMNRTKLESLRKTIVECSDYMVMNHEKITKTYLEGEMDRWLLPESREALKREPTLRELKVWDKYIDEKSEIIDPEEVFSVVSHEFYCDDNIEEEEVNAGICTEYYEALEKSEEEKIKDPGYLEYLSRLDVNKDAGVTISNPLLDNKTVIDVKNKLKTITDLSECALNHIDNYLERDSLRFRKPLKQIVLKMIPLIENVVFKGPLDVDALTNFFSLQHVPPPEIMPRKGNLCFQALMVLYENGPEECKSDTWLETIASELSIEGRLHNRKYEPPSEVHMKIIAPLRRIVNDVISFQDYSQ